MRKKANDAQALLPLPHLNYHVLLALAGGDAHGWAIIKRIGEMTGGATNPSSGSLYLAMVRMEERGLIEAIAAPAGTTDERRRYYKLAPFGRSVLEAESLRLASLVDLAQQWGALGPRRSSARGKA
jgi:DNA-binding PadR family transcriptional regulator